MEVGVCGGLGCVACDDLAHMVKMWGNPQSALPAVGDELYHVYALLDATYHVCDMMCAKTHGKPTVSRLGYDAWCVLVDHSGRDDPYHPDRHGRQSLCVFPTIPIDKVDKVLGSIPGCIFLG